MRCGEYGKLTFRSGRSLIRPCDEVAAVIPTLILVGLSLGRWWKTVLVASATAWPVLLWTHGLVNTAPEIAGAAALALANTAVGAIVHQLVLALVRRAGRHPPAPVGVGP